MEGLRSLFYLVSPSDLTGNRLDFVVGAVPWFIALILLEAAVASCRGYRSYRVNDAFGSFALGLVQQLVGVVVKLVALRLALPTPYVLVLERFRAFDWEPTSIATYVLALLSTDLCYYVYHRSAHAWHVFWTEHSVHHSGEDYNLATALRQSTLGFLTSWLFYVPLAALGLPLGPALAHAQMNLLFQFWIHTAQIGSCGPLEYIINTPSHHRMHHRPPGNCNYAGVLIIWDRLFGTFSPEDEQRDLYGLAAPVATFNPAAINASHWRRLADVGAARADPRCWGRVAALCRRRVVQPWSFNPAGLWAPIPAPKRSLWVLPTVPARPKYQGSSGSPPPGALQAYVAVHGVATVAAGYAVIAVAGAPWAAAAVPLEAVICAVLAVIASVAGLGRLLDDPIRAAPEESVRVGLLAAACMVFAPGEAALRLLLPSLPPALQAAAAPLLSVPALSISARLAVAIAPLVWWQRVEASCAAVAVPPRAASDSEAAKHE